MDWSCLILGSTNGAVNRVRASAADQFESNSTRSAIARLLADFLWNGASFVTFEWYFSDISTKMQHNIRS
jgi:hypothetical protein